MTREEMVLALESIATLASMNLPGIDEADDVIAAIENLRQRVVLSAPCACGGGKVLAEAWAAYGEPFKVRTPKGGPADIRVRIVEVSDLAI